MCGINGIFSYHYAANAIDRCELYRTRDRMTARGPDGKGEWISPDGRTGFGHRYLAVVPSHSGAQPITSADGNLVITLDGAIYNARELRGRLERQGRILRGTSDAEILLHLFDVQGEDMVRNLRGVFAFAIHDVKRRSLFLARDSYGVKPLYYADDGWTFRFASQVKALIAGGAASRDPEPAAEVGFFLWGNVPEPFTLYRAIRSLPAGCTQRVDAIGAHQPRRYVSLAEVFAAGERAQAAIRPIPGEVAATVRAALRDSVRRHLAADGAMCVFLSGGIDSGALVGLMRDAGHRDIHTVTLAFEEFAGTASDEAPLAADVARNYGTRHVTRVVTRGELERDLPDFLEAMDQPTIDGLNMWFAAKAARELGLKVAISGLGGDELFRGYASFRDVPRWVRRMAIPSRLPGLGRLVRRGMTWLGDAAPLHPKAAGMLEYGGSYAGAYLLKRGLFMPRELHEVLDRDTVAQGLQRLAPMAALAGELAGGPRSAAGKVATLEATVYMRNQLLRDADWAGMAHGLEVRMPLVDRVLLGEVTRVLPPRMRYGAGKMLLARAPSWALPEAVHRRGKVGFLTPLPQWMATLPGMSADGGGQMQPWARAWSRAIHATANPPPCAATAPEACAAA
jgi:asparagine synthase (glutamine-hydrolysing)